MQLTRAADYAVRVMIHLATLPPDARASRENLAEAGQIPVHFLSKIMQTLNRAGLVMSHRGAAGGFSLARSARELTLLHIIEAVEGPLRVNQCIDPGQPCVRQGWCPAHHLWVRAQEALEEVLRSETLDQLAQKAVANRGSAVGSEPCVLGGTPVWN